MPVSISATVCPAPLSPVFQTLSDPMTWSNNETAAGGFPLPPPPPPGLAATVGAAAVESAADPGLVAEAGAVAGCTVMVASGVTVTPGVEESRLASEAVTEAATPLTRLRSRVTVPPTACTSSAAAGAPSAERTMTATLPGACAVAPDGINAAPAPNPKASVTISHCRPHDFAMGIPLVGSNHQCAWSQRAPANVREAAVGLVACGRKDP